MNVLVDTSVWINHFRCNDRHLIALLRENQVLMHVMVIGELACGNTKDRAKMLSYLRALPRLPEAQTEDVIDYIENRKLMRKRIGLIDAHLLHATEIRDNTKLWTKDESLHFAAKELGIGYFQNS